MIEKCYMYKNGYNGLKYAFAQAKILIILYYV